jgi:hypothetical protein
VPDSVAEATPIDVVGLAPRHGSGPWRGHRQMKINGAVSLTSVCSGTLLLRSSGRSDCCPSAACPSIWTQFRRQLLRNILARILAQKPDGLTHLRCHANRNYRFA